MSAPLPVMVNTPPDALALPGTATAPMSAESHGLGSDALSLQCRRVSQPMVTFASLTSLANLSPIWFGIERRSQSLADGAHAKQPDP